MSFELFQLGIENDYIQSPNDFYRDLQQSFIDNAWEDTTARITIEEQDKIGPLTFHKIEAWINRAIGETTTFFKNGEDFRQLVFKQIDKPVQRGWMYKFEDNYWIVDFTSPSQGLTSDVLVRRCNNYLRIIDPENGAIFSYPCVIDYDMTSPSIQVNSNIITPNNHATVIVQANMDTMRLFQLNTRYILGGRPFKLYAYQNTLMKETDGKSPNVLYLDLYLDEKHAEDDLVNHIAYNGEFNYSINIDSENMSLVNGATGTLEASVLFNGAEVEKEIIWYSDNNKVVTIKEGAYEVIGQPGESAKIYASLNGNKDVNDFIEIQVVEQEAIQPKIIVEPEFIKIRQFETLKFKVQVSYGGQIIEPSMDEILVSLEEITDEEDYEPVLSNEYVTIQKDESQVQFMTTCQKFSSTSQQLYISVKSIDPQFEAVSVQNFLCVNMLG